MEILKILEDTFLDTYLDVALGEIKAKGYREIEAEVSQRIQKKHNFDLKKEMMKIGISGMKFDTISPLEISKSLLVFITEKYILETSDLRKVLFLKLNSNDRELIEFQKEECRKIIQPIFENKINLLHGIEREMKENLCKAELLNPSPITIQKYCPDQFRIIVEISNKIDEFPEKYAKLFYELKREKVKIRLGKLGNLISGTFGFLNTKNRDKNDMFELLMIN